jgi:hypothetical protein
LIRIVKKNKKKKQESNTGFCTQFCILLRFEINLIISERFLLQLWLDILQSKKKIEKRMFYSGIKYLLKNTVTQNLKIKKNLIIELHKRM